MKTTTTIHLNPKEISRLHNKREEELCKNEPHIDLYNRYGQSSSEALLTKDLRETYIELFQDFIDTYNSKQKRKDRIYSSIDEYMEEVKNDKRGKRQTKKVNGKRVIDEESRQGKQLSYEFTVKVGNTEREKDEFGRIVFDENNRHIRYEYLPRSLQKEILIEYYETFEENNPNFRLVNVDFHGDEGFLNKRNVWEYSVDHLHVEFIPVADGFKRGLTRQNSMNKALQQMGFESKTGDLYELWSKKEQQRLKEITQRKYKEYCEKNQDFYKENGELEIYHPLSDKIRQGDMDKEQYIKEQELKEQEAELNVMQADIETSKALINKISKKKATELTEREEQQNEIEKQFEIVYKQKVQQVNDFISSKKIEFAEKEKEIQEAYKKIEIEKMKINSKFDEIKEKLSKAEKYEDESRKRLKTANSGAERVMGAFIRELGLYGEFLEYCEDYFETSLAEKQSTYDYQLSR